MFHCSWCKNYDVLNFPNNKTCKKCDNGSFLKIKISGIKVCYITREKNFYLEFDHDNTKEAIFEAFEEFDLYNKNIFINISLEFKEKFYKLITIH